MPLFRTLCLVALLLAPAPAWAQTGRDEAQKAGAERVLDDLMAESDAFYLQNAGGYSPGDNRVVVGATLPRVDSPGLCAYDSFTILALPARDTAAPGATAVIRDLESKRLYALLDEAVSPWADDEACAALAGKPSLRDENAPRKADFFAAPNPGAALTTGLLLQSLSVEAGLGKVAGGSLGVRCVHRCPDAEMAKRIFTPAALTAVYDRPSGCPKGHACYKAMLTSRKAGDTADMPDPALWKVEFAVPFGTPRKFAQITLTPMPILYLGGDEIP